MQQSLMQRKPNFDVKINKVNGPWNVGQGTSLKGMSMTITMQGFILAAITDAEKTKLQRNNQTST